MRIIAAFASSCLTATQNTPIGRPYESFYEQLCNPDMLLSLSYKTGMIGLISLVLLPKHLDRSEKWCLELDKALNDADRTGTVVSTVSTLLRGSLSLFRSLLMATMMGSQSSDSSRPSSSASNSRFESDNTSDSERGADISRSNSARNSQFAAFSQALFDTAYRAQTLRCIIDSLRRYRKYIDGLILIDVSQILSDLVHTSNKFIVQFIDCNGLDCLNEAMIFESCISFSPSLELKPDPDDILSVNVKFLHEEPLIAVLQMCSHLARNSEAYFECLQQTFTAEYLVRLLLQLNSAIRSKTCNLIGNFCRHSSIWYRGLREDVFIRCKTTVSGPTTPLSVLIRCCEDADSATRKFACFAVGNAAFHTADLYEQLATAIHPLLSALDDDDEKTRANAAGALGNLVRNGHDLAPALCNAGVIDRLIVMSMHETKLFPQRIALFSLGTMAGHTDCRNRILKTKYGINEVLHYLKLTEPMAGDETMQKYLIRLRSKLKRQTPPS